MFTEIMKVVKKEEESLFITIFTAIISQDEIQEKEQVQTVEIVVREEQLL